MNVVLFGPPGAGKGTQGVMLAEKRGLLKISTGDILRDAVRAGTPLGLQAKKLMDAGELVSDAVILGLVKEAIQNAPHAKGIIMDGFPRTVKQADGVTDMLVQMGKPIDAVIVLEVNDEALVKRLSGRRSCPKCGSVFNIYFDKPKEDGKCDKCQTALIQRADDNQETVVRRLEVYQKQTTPIVSYFGRHGVSIHPVDGDRPIEDVQRDILNIVEP